MEKPGVTGEAVTLWVTGEPFREFLYVDDLASGLLLLAEHYDASSIEELINIGSGEDMKIGDIARIVKETVGFQGRITYDATKPDGMPRKVLDVSLMDRLGWHNRIDLRPGIDRTYLWYTSSLINKKICA